MKFARPSIPQNTRSAQPLKKIGFKAMEKRTLDDGELSHLFLLGPANRAGSS
jgi:hypothetical protein